MPYILNKTNGNALATVGDASVDITTSLTFVGRNYSGYGEVINENFLKMLENFANSTEPSKPILGQLWFDSTSENKRLNVCFDGKNFKGIANIRVQTTTPDSSVKGDLWWDSYNQQLKAYDGSRYQVVGPANSAVAKSSWNSVEEYIQEEETTSYAVLKGLIGTNPAVVVSKENFTPLETSDLYANFKQVKRGLTIAGADSVTGSSTSTGYYFWGTAAESLVATTATNINVTSTTSGIYYVPLVSSTSGRMPVYASSGLTYDASADILYATSVSARFADIAEKYEADAVYDVGTVLIIGGEKEVTVTDQRAHTAVAGIVSKNPSYKMNCDAGPDETHPYIALKGRIPCKIAGNIKKGDMLVTSTRPGYAEAFRPSDNVHAVIGKALEDFEGSFGVIEVKV